MIDMTNKLNNSDCPTCGSVYAKVTDSRPAVFYEIQSIRRRRICSVCNGRYTTYEIPQNEMEDFVKKIKKKLLEKLIKTL